MEANCNVFLLPSLTLQDYNLSFPNSTQIKLKMNSK